MSPLLYSDINKLVGSVDFNNDGKAVAVNAAFLEKFKGQFFTQFTTENVDSIRNARELLEEACLLTKSCLQHKLLIDNLEVLYRCVRTHSGFHMTVLKVERPRLVSEEPGTELKEAVESYSQRYDSFFLMLIDIEDVLGLNASIGFKAANIRLARVAKVIQQQLNVIHDAIFLTVHGGQYAILGRFESNEALKQIHQNILQATTKEFGSNGLFNAGLGEFKSINSDVEAVIVAAQYNLKRAKSLQRRELVTTAGMKVSESIAVNRKQLVSALEEGQFKLHYQPIVDLASGKVVCVEALARWNNPVTGMVPPAQFIDHLHKYKLMDRFGDFLIRQACSDWQQWFQGLVVSVNFSPEQLEAIDFTSRLMTQLRNYGVPANAVQVEVTEDKNHTIGVTNTVRQLTDCGVNVALDDYGTGYCNVAGITSIMASTVKLDRTLISSKLFTKRNPDFVHTVVQMCISLQKKVVVEGVENEEQRDFVDSCGAHMAQGYYFSKPMPPEMMFAKIEELNQLELKHAQCGKR